MSNNSSDFTRSPPAQNLELNRSEAKIAFRTLAPKALDPKPRPISLRTQSTPLGKGFFAFKKQSDRCQVCFKTHCGLVSHKFYGTSTRVDNTGLPDDSYFSKSPTDSRYTASYAHRLSRTFDPPPSPDKHWKPQYDLPLATEMNTVGVHRLFNKCKLNGSRANVSNDSSGFSCQLKENFSLPRPSTMSSDLLHSPLLAPSLLDTTLCLSILAVAAAQQSTDTDPSKNVAALTFIGKAMEHMRERISEHSNFISDNTVAAGALLWAANWYLEDPETMKQHGASVCAFIKTKGGIENLGLSGAIERIVRWADILNSLLLRTDCSFPPLSTLPPLPKASNTSLCTFWQQKDTEHVLRVDIAIIRAYIDTCKLIELVEQFDQHDPSYQAHYQIYHQIEALFVRNAHLQEKHRGQGDLNECFTLALYIIKIRFFWNIQRQHQSLLKINAAALVHSIRTAGRPSFWQKNIAILLWLLFVTELVLDDFHGSDWTRQILRESLETRLGDVDDWREDWMENLLHDLQNFCWSEHRFEPIYERVCNDIVDDLKEMDDD